MASITASSVNMNKLHEELRNRTKSATTLEQASQTAVELLYERFEESIVLARLFVTVKYENLPAQNKQFVDALASSAKIAHLVKTDTLVLSLLGSMGEEHAWRDRRQSRGHIGIPLATADFIDGIPMMSRLLKQLGLGLDWIDESDTALVAKTMGSVSGAFYVRDARSEKDSSGRKIIAAQDFVEQYGVKTVFGIGGGYMGRANFATVILFCRDELEKRTAEHFMGLVSVFKTTTLAVLNSGRVFN